MTLIQATFSPAAGDGVEELVEAHHNSTIDAATTDRIA
jgi:hypothetical protein